MNHSRQALGSLSSFRRLRGSVYFLGAVAALALAACGGQPDGGQLAEQGVAAVNESSAAPTARELALFDATRNDVTEVFDADHRAVGLVNKTYQLVWISDRGFAKVDAASHSAVWGFAQHIPTSELDAIEAAPPAKVVENGQPQRHAFARTCVEVWVRIIAAGVDITVYWTNCNDDN